jgi:uncharacterized protein (TIGR02147 family)
METPSVFVAKGYRSFLKDWIESQSESRGLLSRFCLSMQCQNAHLTRVLQERVHLTMDQAYRAIGFVKLDTAEAQFFLKLTEHDRAGDSHYRRHLREEMDRIRTEQQNLAKKFQRAPIGNFEQEMTSYSSWHWIATHYITAIKEYQNAAQIAERLGLSEGFAKQSLEVLERFGLVKKSGAAWTLNSGSIFLSKDSPLNSTQHGNWRNRAVLKSQDRNDDGIHFTMVQTLSHQDFENLKQLLLKTIDDYRKVADPSDPEELICFTLDFFRA